MNTNAPVMLRGPVVAVAAIVLLGVGAGSTYLFMRTSAGADRRGPSNGGQVNTAPTGATEAPSMVMTPAGASKPSNASDVPLPDVVVTLSPEAMTRAGVELASVTRGAGSSIVRIPGTVEPNAYQEVAVTSLVPGRVTRVLVELGQPVRRGQPLVEVFAPDLADAQTKYLSATAELQAHERELDRATRLVAIGAASQQELERLHAEHAAKLAGVQSLRSRLVLLGVPAPAIDALAPGTGLEATTSIPAPLAGVITERGANVGLNVDTTTKLFTVVDLSSVWVVGALYEKDFPRVRVGSTAVVTSSVYPALNLSGRVSYIDPQVSADTRTARVRVEVANARQELRLGMFADIEITTTGDRQALMIPREAVQNVGDRPVVYLGDPNQAGKFIEREVRLGQPSGEHVEVVSGVGPADRVVSKGSFFIRAERERLGLPHPSPKP